MEQFPTALQPPSWHGMGGGVILAAQTIRREKISKYMAISPHFLKNFDQIYPDFLQRLFSFA